MKSKGQKAFDACDVKAVEFKSFVYKSGDSGDSMLSPNPSEDTRIYAGSSAVLHCPRTEDDRVTVQSQYTNHSSDKAALGSLRQTAGELLCRDCIFSTMSPIEVSRHRTELARAEIERTEVYKALDAAHEEIKQLGLPSDIREIGG